MANIIIGAPYLVLTKEQYTELTEIISSESLDNFLGDFFQLPNYPDLYFALSSDLTDGDYDGITEWLDPLTLGEAYFTTSVQANIYVP